MTATVLDAMQIFDEQIAPARAVFQQRPYFLPRPGIDVAAFGPAADLRRPRSNFACLLTLHMPSLPDLRSVAYAGGPGNSRSTAAQMPKS